MKVNDAEKFQRCTACTVIVTCVRCGRVCTIDVPAGNINLLLPKMINLLSPKMEINIYYYKQSRVKNCYTYLYLFVWKI